jgi:glucose-1-phosphate adenylyltransferase
MKVHYAHGGAVNQTLALVLAGGRGERLNALTDRQAKPGLQFGGKFRMIDFPLSNSVNSGIRRIAVATQYRAHDLMHHVQRTWGFLRPEMNEFVELWPAQQQTAAADWYSGTADAVYQNISLIRRHAPRYVLILAGDHVYKQDYRVMMADHIDSDADATVACLEIPREEGRRFGIVNANAEGLVTEFLEKPASPPGLADDPGRCLASMGVYIFNTDVLIDALRADAKRPDSAHDFGRDIIPAMLDKYRLFAHRFSKSCVGVEKGLEPYWRDVGTLDAYWAAHADIVKSEAPFDLYDADWPIWTQNEHLPPPRFISGNEDRRSLVADSVVGDGAVIAGATVRGSVLFNRAHINSGAKVSDSVILPGCIIGAGARLDRCILGEGCNVPPGLVVGENAEDDARRFHRTAQGVTLITQKMLSRLTQPEAPKRGVASLPAPISLPHPSERVRMVHSVSDVA